MIESEDFSILLSAVSLVCVCFVFTFGGSEVIVHVMVYIPKHSGNIGSTFK